MAFRNSLLRTHVTVDSRYSERIECEVKAGHALGFFGSGKILRNHFSVGIAHYIVADIGRIVVSLTLRNIGGLPAQDHIGAVYRHLGVFHRLRFGITYIVALVGGFSRAGHIAHHHREEVFSRCGKSEFSGGDLSSRSDSTCRDLGSLFTYQHLIIHISDKCRAVARLSGSREGKRSRQRGISKREPYVGHTARSLGVNRT